MTEAIKAEQANIGDWVIVSEHYAAAFQASALPYQTGRVVLAENHKMQVTNHVEFLYITESRGPQLKKVELACFTKIERVK